VRPGADDVYIDHAHGKWHGGARQVKVVAFHLSHFFEFAKVSIWGSPLPRRIKLPGARAGIRMHYSQGYQQGALILFRTLLTILQHTRFSYCKTNWPNAKRPRQLCLIYIPPLFVESKQIIIF
jgi:hypothetical protein